MLGFVAEFIIKDDLLTVKENLIAAQSFTSGEIMKCSHAIHYAVRVDNRATSFCCNVNYFALVAQKTRLLSPFLI
jgi:hypothetical protein